MNKPYAESCDQNREPIFEILKDFVDGKSSLLEIGSGTGQHAVYFARQFPWIEWQTSDQAEYHDGIQAWIVDGGLPNVKSPLLLDVRQPDWYGKRYDLIFSANTLHIMSEYAVEHLFNKLPLVMHGASQFLVYGPFNYQGRYTSDSNARFDSWLKQRDIESGIKNFEWLQDIAAKSGLECSHDFAMPANNRILVWQRTGG